MQRANEKSTDVLILGAGAAGMFCAIEAGRRGRRVVLLDHARAPGEKIRISGGGRCNFTNLHIAPERFLSDNPRFALSALNRYKQDDFIARVDQAGIAWHEKTLGQLFCDGSARQIIDMLVRDMAEAGVELHLSTEVRGVRQDGDAYIIETSHGTWHAASLVVATGGKSIPKMGATSIGYQLATQFGLRVTDTRPALVPLTFTDGSKAEMAALSGLSVAARVSCRSASFEEGLLFTHRGLSGPSILQISSYWREGDAIAVDLATGQSTYDTLRERRSTSGRVSVKNALTQVLPENLARAVTARARVDGRLADQSDKTLMQLSEAVHDWRIVPAGSEGYRTAEVTLGGVDTRDLDARTMMARKVPGLYFVGEVVDVTGWLGGYNFQWAWSSGWAAGQVC
ncbi:MAG: NAD(P)/FAD-dependent oxidoreductase [Paracoccaceae bacterium]